MLVRSDHATGTSRAIAERRRNCQLSPTADLHALHALIPAADDLASTKLELEGVAAIPRSVKLISGVPRHSDVVNLREMAGSCNFAFAFEKIIDTQLLPARLLVGKGDNGFALAHGANAI